MMAHTAEIAKRPECPNGHGYMTLRPVERLTYEQRWFGVWYDCTPATDGLWCRSSVLLETTALRRAARAER